MSERLYPGSELELFAGADTWKRYFAAQLRPYIGRRVLEVGAGLGETTTRLCEAESESWRCLEPDPGLAAELARKLCSGELPACCSVQGGTIADLEASDAFDTILYIDVLEHIEDDGSEFREAARHLTPGGHLVVLAPASPSLFSSFDEHVGHFRRYDRRALGALTADGLDCVRVFHLDSVGYLLSLANRLALRQSLPTAGQIAFWDRVIVPLSRGVDRLTRWRFGRSVIGVWRRRDRESA